MPERLGFRQISGTSGKLYWDGELIYEVSSFEAKYTFEREDVKFAGSSFTDSKLMGVKGEGSFKVLKMFSRGQKKLLAAIKQGRDVRSQLIGSVSDPDAYGSERVVLNNVWFNDLSLLKFEIGAKTEEEFSFGFTDCDFPDTITPRG